jgi:hypothetical protein
MRRCHSEAHRSYKYYGARGIKVCERWQLYKAFLEDMGERPTGTTLDRIDGFKGYEPGNCRWATKAEQQANPVSGKRAPTHDYTVGRAYSNVYPRSGQHLRTDKTALEAAWASQNHSF